MKKRCIFLFLLSMPLAAAEGYVSIGVDLLLISTGLLFVATLLLLPFRSHLNDTTKKIAFWAITIPVVASTVFFAGSIIHENIVSETGGPIHWHADYRIFVCGEEIDLVDPDFPRNKVGNPLFHEHDDHRVHVEGTVMSIPDVDFGEYFAIVGGLLEDGHLVYPTEEGVVEVSDGDSCKGQPSDLKVYVNGEQIDDYENHLIYPDAYVPPGDCIILLFDETNNPTTDILCDSWAAKDWNYDDYKRREVTIGDRAWQ